MLSRLGVLQCFAGLGTRAGTAMVSTWSKAVNKRNLVSQTVVQCNQVVVQVPGYRECQSVSLSMVDCRDESCAHSEQVNDLKEEVERLRCTRECEWEINW